jgi:hypothetical protein
MIRLKSAHFHHPVGEAGSSRAELTWPPPMMREGQCDLQVEGGFVALFVRGNPIPRLVPLHNVRQLEPTELPKGFAEPTWTTLDAEINARLRKAEADRLSAAKAAAVAKAAALPGGEP